MDKKLKNTIIKRVYLFIIYCIIVWFIGQWSKLAAALIAIVSFFITVWYFYANYKDVMKQFDKQTGIMSNITNAQMEASKQWQKVKKPKIAQKWYHQK